MCPAIPTHLPLIISTRRLSLEQVRVPIVVEPCYQTRDAEGPSSVALRIVLLHLRYVPRYVLQGDRVFDCEAV